MIDNQHHLNECEQTRKVRERVYAGKGRVLDL